MGDPPASARVDRTTSVAFDFVLLAENRIARIEEVKPRHLWNSVRMKSWVL